MAATLLSDDGVSRLVQLSVEYEGGWYGSGLKQKAVGFDGREREVSLIKVEGAETPPTSLTLTFDEMCSLVQEWQAYIQEQERRRASAPAPLVDVDPFA